MTNMRRERKSNMMRGCHLNLINFFFPPAPASMVRRFLGNLFLLETEMQIQLSSEMDSVNQGVPCGSFRKLEIPKQILHEEMIKI